MRKRGRARMRELGHTAVELWFSPDELAIVRAASRAACKSLATYIRERIIGAAASETQFRSAELRELAARAKDELR